MLQKEVAMDRTLRVTFPSNLASVHTTYLEVLLHLDLAQAMQVVGLSTSATLTNMEYKSHEGSKAMPVPRSWMKRPC